MGKIEDSKELIIRMLEKLRSIFHPHRLAQFTNLIELTFQPKILPLRSGMQKSLAEESKNYTTTLVKQFGWPVCAAKIG